MLSVVIGTVMDVISGYFGGWVDSAISRTMDIFLAFPILLFAIALAGVLADDAFGLSSDGLRIAVITFIIGFFNWPTSDGSSAARRSPCASGSSWTRHSASGPRRPYMLHKEMLPNLVWRPSSSTPRC